jgi:disulfide bond formation protein DsbB
MTVFELNDLVALGTLGMEALSITLLALFIFGKAHPATKLVERFALPFSLAVVLAGIVVSLIYSDYFGIEPCFLCWYQRVFLYPQALLFALAWWKKDARVADYSIAFSIAGSVFALYQHYIQMVGESPFPCPANGGDCLKRFLFAYDHITFPWVAFVTFALLIVVMLFVRRSARERA